MNCKLIAMADSDSWAARGEQLLNTNLTNRHGFCSESLRCPSWAARKEHSLIKKVFNYAI